MFDATHKENDAHSKIEAHQWVENAFEIRCLHQEIKKFGQGIFRIDSIHKYNADVKQGR